MTYTEEFIPEEEQSLGEEGDYPTAFGITFTPKVSGIAIGLLGLIASAYLFMTFGLPVLTELGELKIQEADKQAQVDAKESGKLDEEKLNVEGELKRTQLTKQQVLALYAQPDTLNTILLNLNRFIKERNVKLTSFQPTGDVTLVNDGSLGAAVNGKLKRQSYTISINGTYENVQAFLRDVERLQPLIVVRNLSASLGKGNEEDKNKIPVTLIENPDREVYAIPNPENPATLDTQLTLDVILSAN